MILHNMFKKTPKKSYITIKGAPSKPEVPQGLLRKCNNCQAAVLTDEVVDNRYICPKCETYFRMHAYRRIEMLTEEGAFEEWDIGLETKNPLHYKGYPEKVKALQEKTGLDEAVITGSAVIGRTKTALCVCDGRFMMASMGEVVGEKITRAVERAAKEHMPLIIFACSGGARMQEGMVSLMQMAKTSAALKRLSDAGELFISVLTDPTTGGVTASFAMLGDIILAEPKALIGFAGPRVIEQTIGEKLPKGFQRSEFLLEHGFIDAIVERKDLKDTLCQILELHKHGKYDGEYGELKEELQKIQGQKIQEQKDESKESDIISAWDSVLISRKNDRPVGEEYIEALFDDFIEMHGDRCFKDDKAIIGGIARFHGIPVTVIAQAKGRCTSENIERNFGMPSPDGYRKAQRLMKQAQKFYRPIICFVDTPGAFCGLEAEERGQGESIARSLFEMSGLTVPILSVVIGEGGSGGALAMAVADEVWMLRNSIYSILSPEGYASILWKDSKRAKEAAQVMRLTAKDLKEMGMIERIINEPESFTMDTMEMVCKEIDKNIIGFLKTYQTLREEELLERRYQRFRKF